jgi:hypothetical protein
MLSVRHEGRKYFHGLLFVNYLLSFSSENLEPHTAYCEVEKISTVYVFGADCLFRRCSPLNVASVAAAAAAVSCSSTVLLTCNCYHPLPRCDDKMLCSAMEAYPVCRTRRDFTQRAIFCWQ